MAPKCGMREYNRPEANYEDLVSGCGNGGSHGSGMGERPERCVRRVEGGGDEKGSGWGEGTCIRGVQAGQDRAGAAKTSRCRGRGSLEGTSDLRQRRRSPG